MTSAADSARSAVITARLRPDAAAQLRQLAQRDGVTVSTYVSSAVADLLQQQESLND
jgi:predicted transcriptional regulator